MGPDFIGNLEACLSTPGRLHLKFAIYHPDEAARISSLINKRPFIFSVKVMPACPLCFLSSAVWRFSFNESNLLILPNQGPLQGTLLRLD